MEIALTCGVLIDPSVNGLVADSHGLIVGIINPQAACDGFRRPVETKLRGDVGDKPVVPSTVMSCFVAPLLHGTLDTMVPLDVTLLVVGEVPLDLPAHTRMVSPQTTADLSQRESGERQMTDDIALFSGKMMVGHDGLLSG
jgi:hypothetical protein